VSRWSAVSLAVSLGGGLNFSHCGRHAKTRTKVASTTRIALSGMLVAIATPNKLPGSRSSELHPTTGHAIERLSNAAREALETSWIAPWIEIAVVGATN